MKNNINIINNKLNNIEHYFQSLLKCLYTPQDSITRIIFIVIIDTININDHSNDDSTVMIVDLYSIKGDNRA